MILHIVEHTLLDCIKLLPFLFITYLIMEYIEHKTKEKTKTLIKSSLIYIIGNSNKNCTNANVIELSFP